MVELDFATIDFETYYSKDYSLSKMMTDAYVLDPRFQIIGVSARPSVQAEAQWFASPHEDEVRDFLRETIDWENTPVCAHHAHFDAFIATQRLGLKPLLWLDTLSMARTVYPRRKAYSLAALAADLLGGLKGNEVVAAIGKRYEDFTPLELARYGDYCLHDTNLCCLLASMLLSDKITALEVRLIDMTVRMFSEPVLEGDVALLRDYHKSEVERKEALLLATSADKSIIMSNPKFAEALEALGVRPPRKVSPTTGKETYAFAKTDKAFTALLEHPNEDVQTLVAARLGVKSTIAETRALKFIEMAERGPLPMYLQHAGAKTTLRHCLTGDTVIQVLRGGVILDILLPDVRTDDLVWDGEEFVSHGGLVDQGEREVMSYGGITGTPDHRVFCEETLGAVELREASERGYTLKTARAPGLVRTGATDTTG